METGLKYENEVIEGEKGKAKKKYANVCLCVHCDSLLHRFDLWKLKKKKSWPEWKNAEISNFQELFFFLTVLFDFKTCKHCDELFFSLLAQRKNSSVFYFNKTLVYFLSIFFLLFQTSLKSYGALGENRLYGKLGELLPVLHLHLLCHLMQIAISVSPN